MISLDEYTQLADRAMEQIPREVFYELNGGVIVREDAPLHPQSQPNAPMYILGQYHSDSRGLGRYVLLFYGSFVRIYPNATTTDAYPRIREILGHELTHHLENLAGERDLEYEDARTIARYRRQYPDASKEKPIPWLQRLRKKPSEK